MLKTRKRRLLIACFLAAACFLSTMLISSTASIVAGGDLPPRLPPRPGEPEEPAPDPSLPMPITGATIQLQASESFPGAWTVVEWQNEHGDWFVVNGWQGHLDDGDDNMKSWWVYPDDFGKGPFRWKVFDAEAGNILATSDSFDLPTENYQLVFVNVELP